MNEQGKRERELKKTSADFPLVSTICYVFISASITKVVTFFQDVCSGL